MKRGIVIVAACGLAGVGLGIWLMGRGRPSPALDMDGGFGGVEGNPDRGGTSRVAAGEAMRWTGVQAGTGEAAREGGGDATAGALGLPADAEPAWAAAANAGMKRLPERATELLALGDPAIQAVAEILTEAGVAGADLEDSLRGVYGHVQRLAMFETLARDDAEKAQALDRLAAAASPAEREGIPSLQWRVEVWPRRSREYVAYVRRDLETRFGIVDESVVARLVGVAERLAGGLAGGTGTEAPPSPSARDEPGP